MPERVYKRLIGEEESTPTSTSQEKGKINGTRSLDTRGKKRKRDDPQYRVVKGSRLSSEGLPNDPAKQERHPTTEPNPNPPNQQLHHKTTKHSPQNPKTNGTSHKHPPNYSPHNNLKARASSLLAPRKSLPIWSHAPEIRTALLEKDILLLAGETGSGKSTQVPQILASEPWARPKTATLPQPTQPVRIGGCIAITEPRRVAAISLARRVAEEMGSTLGSASPNSTVGYSVRFDNSTSSCTRIKFLTEGMLLREMLGDPWLRAYSAVVVDEVHERGVNVDLVLGFLRGMVCAKGEGERLLEGRSGVPLKVVVMSATAEMERLESFFGEAREDEHRAETGFGKTSNGREKSDVEDGSESEWSGFSSSDEDENKEEPKLNGTSTANPKNEKGKNQPNGKPNGQPPSTTTTHKPPDPSPTTQNPDTSLTFATPPINLTTLTISGRLHPVYTSYTPNPVLDILDASLRTIFAIHSSEPMPGDILVFLTGQETVESLLALVTEYSLSLPPTLPKILCLPLFAALPQTAQQLVFSPPPPKTRKVILATNIAETSVTVPGVRFVIDSGKHKTKQYRPALSLESLLVKPISKSAAIQRKGRAGREALGKCYRLYTEQSYLNMEMFNIPEVLRCDLSHAILTMKARGVGDVLGFAWLDAPPRGSVEKALLGLYQFGALTETGGVSEIGRQIARLPLSVQLGRVLIAAAESEFDCVGEVIDVISCLSVENVFLNISSEEKKEEAAAARRELWRREGDHLTLLATVTGFVAEKADRRGWAERRFVSHRAMRAVMDVRKQLRALCVKDGTLDVNQEEAKEGGIVSAEKGVSVLKAFLRGFAMNTARLMPDGSYKTLVGNQSVAIHPSSGLFGERREAVVYNEFVFTNRCYARGVSAVQMDWVGEALGG